MSSILELFGGKNWNELSDDELQEFVQARRRDITAIMEEDTAESRSSGPTLGKKTKASKGSEDLL